jgi:RNA polymerase sigma-70 factor (ECF subfamily)
VQQEGSLVRRAQQGEPEAFEQLYEAHFDKIYRYIMLRLKNQAEAEDLTQQVFLKALESLGNYNWRGVPFSSWLFRIAHNQVVDYVRRGSKMKMLALDESGTLSESNPVMMAEKNLKLRQVAMACEKLSEGQREVISMRFAGGLTVAETAKAMDKSEGAVKVLQHAALVKLRQILSPGDGR